MYFLIVCIFFSILCVVGIIMFVSYYTFYKGSGYVRMIGIVTTFLSYMSLHVVLFTQPSTRTYAYGLFVAYPVLAYGLYITITNECIACPKGYICNKSSGICESIDVIPQDTGLQDLLAQADRPGFLNPFSGSTPAASSSIVQSVMDKCGTESCGNMTCCGEGTVCNRLPLSSGDDVLDTQYTCCRKEQIYYPSQSVGDSYCCPDGTKPSGSDSLPNKCVPVCGPLQCSDKEQCLIFTPPNSTECINKTDANNCISTQSDLKTLAASLQKAGISNDKYNYDASASVVYACSPKTDIQFDSLNYPDSNVLCYRNPGSNSPAASSAGSPSTSTTYLRKDGGLNNDFIQKYLTEKNQETKSWKNVSGEGVDARFQKYECTNCTSATSTTELALECARKAASVNGLTDVVVDSQNNLCYTQATCTNSNEEDGKFGDKTVCNGEDFACCEDGHVTNRAYYYIPSEGGDADKVSYDFVDNIINNRAWTNKNPASDNPLLDPLKDLCESSDPSATPRCTGDARRCYVSSNPTDYSGGKAYKNNKYLDCRVCEEDLQTWLNANINIPSDFNYDYVTANNACPAEYEAVPQIKVGTTKGQYHNSACWNKTGYDCTYRGHYQVRCCRTNDYLKRHTDMKQPGKIVYTDSGTNPFDGKILGCTDKVWSYDNNDTHSLRSSNLGPGTPSNKDKDKVPSQLDYQGYYDQSQPPYKPDAGIKFPDLIPFDKYPYQNVRFCSKDSGITENTLDDAHSCCSRCG